MKKSFITRLRSFVYALQGRLIYMPHLANMGQ